MVINKYAFDLVGVTLSEYKQWCRSAKVPTYKRESKELFFKRVLDGDVVRTKDGRLIDLVVSGNKREQ